MRHRGLARLLLGAPLITRRPVRRLGALVAAGALATLALAGCTPSLDELEQRTASSAFKAFYGRGGGNADCSLELTSQELHGDRYEGTCTVQGTTFSMEALYDETAPGWWTAYVVARMPIGTLTATHSCGFERRGEGAWKLGSQPCLTVSSQP